MQYQSRGVYPHTNPVALQLTERAAKMLKGKAVKDAYDYIAYDTLRFEAAAVPTSDLFLFTNGIGQTVSVANVTADQYVKTFVDTNLQDGNRLPAGQCLIVDSIQFMVQLTGSPDTTYATTSPGTSFPTNTAPAANPISAVNLITAILQQCYATFTVGEKDYEQGPLYQFPSDFGVSGFAGSGSGTAVTVNLLNNSEVAVNNGFGRARILAIQREIPSLVNFRMKLNFIQALTISRQFTIRCLLRGILYRPVQ
jgi:hypothetical protein